jgi:hypothetical protein
MLVLRYNKPSQVSRYIPAKEGYVIIETVSRRLILQRIISEAGLIYYQFEMWKNAPFKHGTFTRHGGVSDAPWGTLNLGRMVGDEIARVRENHRRVYDCLGVDANRACTVWQVHSADTVIVTAPPTGQDWLSQADGMVTNQEGLSLVMRFADCVPILFYDPVRHVIGIAHAGWRGTLSGVQVNVVNTMCQAYGSKPADIQACIGPSIGPDHYQVGKEVVDQAAEVFDSLDGIIRQAADGSAYLNLWEANQQLLEQTGIEQIEIAGICTATHTDEFFSHRAEQGRTGRFGAVIAL